MTVPNVVACPHCGGQISNDPSLAGKQVACPHCNRPLLMPARPVLPRAQPIVKEPPSVESESLDFLESLPVTSGAPSHSVSQLSTKSWSYNARRKKKSNTVLWITIGIPAALIGLSVLGAIVGGSGERKEGAFGGQGAGFGLVGQIKAHDGHIRALAFSPDGKFLLSGGDDRVIRLWGFPSATLVKEFKGHRANVNGLRFFGDGNSFLSASDDHTIRLWKRDSPTAIAHFDGHTKEVICVALSLDGKTFVSGGRDETLRLWDIGSRRQLASVPLPDSVYILSIALASDGRYCLCGLGSGMVLVDLKERSVVREWRREMGGTVGALMFLPGVDRAVSTSGCFPQLWNIGTGEEVRRFKGHRGHVVPMAISADGKLMLTGAQRSGIGASSEQNNDFSLRLWSIGSGKELFRAIDHKASVWEIALTENGRYAASCDGDGTLIWLWHLPSEAEARQIPLATESTAGPSDSEGSAEMLTRQEVIMRLKSAGAQIGHTFPEDGVLETQILFQGTMEDWLRLLGKPEMLSDRYDSFVDMNYQRWRYRCKDGPLTFHGNVYSDGHHTYMQSTRACRY